MKRIWIALALVTMFILVHGTWTFRVNHQRAFAQAVEKKIDIESIHVKAMKGTLVLTGKATKPQSDYAEDVARTFIAKYSRRSINPPKDIRNEIEVGNVVTTFFNPAAARDFSRDLASSRGLSKVRRRN